MSKVIKIYDATITTGEYQNAQGEQKKSYLKVGTLFQYEDGGLSLKLDAVPVGNGNINFYERKPKEQGYQQPQQQGYQQATPQNNIDDPNRHNVGGNMNRPSQQQQIGTAPNGSPIYG